MDLHTGPRTRRILDAIWDAFLEVDSQAVITEWNCQAESLFGWARSEVLGQPVKLISPSCDEMFALARAGVAEDFNEAIVRRRDGSESPVQARVIRLPLAERSPWCAFLRDVSGVRALEAALRSCEERIKMLDIIEDGSTPTLIVPTVQSSDAALAG